VTFASPPSELMMLAGLRDMACIGSSARASYGLHFREEEGQEVGRSF